jgi:hypothetical protein
LTNLFLRHTAPVACSFYVVPGVVHPDAVRRDIPSARLSVQPSGVVQAERFSEADCPAHKTRIAVRPTVTDSADKQQRHMKKSGIVILLHTMRMTTAPSCFTPYKVTLANTSSSHVPAIHTNGDSFPRYI